MKFLNITLGLLLSAFLFVSCNNAQSTIADLENLVTEIDELPADFTEEDLQKIVAEHEEISKNIEKYEYTDEELAKIGKLQGKYAAKMTKASMKNIGNSLKNFGKKVESGIKGFVDEMDEEEE